MISNFWYTLDSPLARLAIDYFQNLTENTIQNRVRIHLGQYEILGAKP